MKKRIVIKLSGRVFGADNVKVLKDYAEFLVKISKICQPIVVAGGGGGNDVQGLGCKRRNGRNEQGCFNH